MKNKTVIIFSIALIITSLSLVYFTNTVLQKKKESEGAPLPGISPITTFDLVDQDNNKVSNLTLLGSPWIANFIFTRCGGPCPIMSSKMYKIQDQTPDNVKLVSFSVDPEYDTPEVLKEYAGRYRAKEGKWFFLTGNKKLIHNLSRQTFKLAIKETPEEGENNAFVHSTKFILIDSNGMIRGYYDSNDETEIQKLLEDLKKII